MKDLITKLEAAPEADQEGLILDALQLAFLRDWITNKTFTQALGWVLSGAYLSAAVVLVPEGLLVTAEWCNDWADFVIRGYGDGGKWLVHSKAATPALAFTIVALRAQDETEQSHP